VANLVDRRAEHVGRSERADLLPRIAVVELNVAGEVAVVVRVVRLCLGDRLLAGNVWAVDINVPQANLAELAVRIVADRHAALIGHLDKVERGNAGP
jgi:hypothetical protein